MKKRVIVIAVLVSAVIATVLLIAPRWEDAAPQSASAEDSAGPAPRRTEGGLPNGATTEGTDLDPSATQTDDDGADESEPAFQTEEEIREAAEEKVVQAFDDLTDKWMAPSGAGVTLADVDAFVGAFRRVPKARQDECIHRALNLVPDENVMLLAGVLMDREMDREIVETVFADILNRDETVKKPILQQVFKDKTHPCWTDTAWILDVTGELPKAK